MPSRYEIHFPVTSNTGGSAPIDGSDKFAPKYLVGNVPNGDPAVATPGPFFYFPDTGNGAGIAAALAAALASQGDVWIRPGIYDMNLPGAPAGPFMVPPGCRATGTGIDVTGGGGPVGQIVGRTTGDQGVFILEDAAALRDLCIITSATPGGPFAGSVDLIRCNAAAQINNVVLLSTGGDLAEVLRNFIGIYGESPVEIDGVFAQGSGFNAQSDADWRNFVRVFEPAAVVSIRNAAVVNFDVCLWQDGGSLIASLLNVQMIGVNRRGIYQASGLPAFVSMDASCLVIAQDANCIGAELWSISGNLAVVSQITKSRFYGGALMLGAAVLVHGDVAPSSGGRVRVQGNFMLWPRAGGPVVELGLVGSLEQCDRCSVEHNIIMNLDVLGEGVRVSNVNCNKNIIGGGSIEVTVPANALVDFGTLTTSYPISV